MKFYFAPPSIRIALAEFENCCTKRFTDFLETAKTKNYETIDQELNVNSDFDEIGHFFLRCFCVYKPEMKNFILGHEINLFLYRLETVPWELKRKLYRDTVKQIHRVHNVKLHDPITQNTRIPYSAELLCSTLAELCETLLIPQIEHHVSKHCDINCSKYLQKVPFQMCLLLTQNRSVFLKDGCAFIPCSMWNFLLGELFQYHYDFGLMMISSTVFLYLESDSRWIWIFEKLAKLYDSSVKTRIVPNTSLTAEQIDDEKRYFPPCMAHLLTTLRNLHRLSHYWRFRFSLFLKDIGLSVDESIEFWKKEYSKSCTAESRCTHSWQINRKKYVYSIHHIYGLVGSGHKNQIKSCLEYQDMKLSMREEGGCPFVHFDDNNLLSSLSKEIRDDSSIVNKILEQRTLKNPIQACHLYYEACASKYYSQIPVDTFKSPVEYYSCMKQCCNTLDW